MSQRLHMKLHITYQQWYLSFVNLIRGVQAGYSSDDHILYWHSREYSFNRLSHITHNARRSDILLRATNVLPRMIAILDFYSIFFSFNSCECITIRVCPVQGSTVYPKKYAHGFALLCFVVVIYWLIFPYPSSLLHWHCGNLTNAPVPAKQPWWIWINTSCEFIMNDCITTTKQSTTKPCAYFLGYTVGNGLIPYTDEYILWLPSEYVFVSLNWKHRN